MKREHYSVTLKNYYSVEINRGLGKQPTLSSKVKNYVGVRWDGQRWVVDLRGDERPSADGARFFIRSMTGTYLDMSPSVNRHHWVPFIRVKTVKKWWMIETYRGARCFYCGASMPKDGSISRWCTGAR